MSDELQRFIDSLHDEVLVLGPGYVIARVNRALLHGLGRSADEVIGRHCYEVYHDRSTPCSLPETACPAAEAWESGHVGWSVRARPAGSGSERCVEVVASPMLDDDGHVRQVIEVMRDVSSQKQVEAELVQRNRELAALLGMVGAVTRSLDLETTLREGLRHAASVIGADAGAIFICDTASSGELVLAVQQGLDASSAEALPGSSWVGDIRSRILEADATLIVEPSPPELTACLISGDDALACTLVSRALKVTGRLVGILAVIVTGPHDVTPPEAALLTGVARGLAVAIENVRLFENVLRTEREWEQTFAAIRDGIAITNAEHKIVRVNQAFLDMFGLAEEQVVGERCCKIFYGHTGPAPWFRCHQILETNQAMPIEVDSLTIPGTFHISLFPLYDEHGAYAGLIHSVRDVSEESAVRDIMARNERLIALGRLAASVAHEINNPLFSIRNCLALLDDVIPDDEPTKSFLHLARGELDRLGQTVRSLLDFVRPGDEPRAPVDLNQVLERATLMTGKQMEYAHVTVVRELDEALPALVASGDQLTQVAINLILNAIEAMPDGGQLCISTRLGPMWDDVEAAPGRVVETVQMIVADTGTGIPPEQLEAIFEPFYSTKEEVKGVGLGLSISHSIIQHHHGAIDVQSKVDGGSTFVITLPLLTEEEWESLEHPRDVSSS